MSPPYAPVSFTMVLNVGTENATVANATPFVSFGDNDSHDCEHSGFSFWVEIDLGGQQ